MDTIFLQSPELAGPKTATENVRMFPASWPEAFSQSRNEILVPLSPTDIVVAGKSMTSTLAGCARVFCPMPVEYKHTFGKTRGLGSESFSPNRSLRCATSPS